MKFSVHAGYRLPLLSTMGFLWLIQSMKGLGLRQYRLEYRFPPTLVWSPPFRNREDDRLESAKDRLPCDLYINEPGIKFNTCWTQGVGNGGKNLRRVLLPRDILSTRVTESPSSCHVPDMA